MSFDIKKAAPDAEEGISYQMPTFTLNGPLVYFGAFKKHIGLYPPVRRDENLMSEMSIYEGEKGNLRFPLDKPIPYALISKIVKVRIRENQGGVGTKQRSNSVGESHPSRASRRPSRASQSLIMTSLLHARPARR